MQAKGVAPSGMGAVVGVVGSGVGVGKFELSEEEKSYYMQKVREAEEIVERATLSNANLHREYVTAVFGKIASPLFYIRSEKREEVKSERPGQARIKRQGEERRKQQDARSKKQQEAKQMGKKEDAKGLAVEFVCNVLTDKSGDVGKEWRVASETENVKWYRVRGDPSKDDYKCECPDFTYRGHDCKHIKAVRSLI